MGEYKFGKIDIPLVVCWLLLIFIGWINIFASVYSEEHSSIFDMSQRYGMQLLREINFFIHSTSFHQLCVRTNTHRFAVV